MRACPKCGQKFTGSEDFCPKDGISLVDLDDPSDDDFIGTTIDERYTIEKKLGEGGMGVVYQATHAVIGKGCAIKVLRKDLSSENEASERFTQEARAAAAIGNEHIIEINDFGRLSDGSAYFVMEMLDGLTLHEAIAQASQVEIERVLHIIIQCCDALAAAHNSNIVHRDLKPENIFLIHRHGDPDFVKILDFGIAKMARESGRLTRTGVVFGTPQYMSPEQAAGTNMDTRTDIYSLGIIMYEMLCGHVPFEADTFMGVLTKHLYEEPIPPAQLVPPVKIPQALEAVVLKSISKKPEKRYQTMDEFSEDLKAVLDGKTPTIVYDQMRDTSASTLPPLSPAEIVSGKKSSIRLDEDVTLPRARWPLFAGIASLLVIAIVVGVILFGGNDKQKAQAQPVKVPVAAPAAPVKVETKAPEKRPAEAAKIEQVLLKTKPDGAFLYKQGSLLGQTPFKVPKPKGEKGAHHYEIRLMGYEKKEVVVITTTPDEMLVSLDKKRRRSKETATQKPDPKPVTKKPIVVAPDPPPKKKKKKKKKSTSSGDIKDPWAD